MTPQKKLAKILTAKKLKLRIAESFTGGHLTSLLTAIPGASEYLVETIVAYTPEAKQKRLGVPADTIERYGAVSAVCCREMLKGLLKEEGCNLAIATTGNAGPYADPPDTLGVCYIGAASRDRVVVRRRIFDGTRKNVIKQGANAALSLALEIINSPPPLVSGILSLRVI